MQTNVQLCEQRQGGRGDEGPELEQRRLRGNASHHQGKSSETEEWHRRKLPTVHHWLHGFSLRLCAVSVPGLRAGVRGLAQGGRESFRQGRRVSSFNGQLFSFFFFFLFEQTMIECEPDFFEYTVFIAS